MKEQTASQIIKINQASYNEMGQKFSDSRYLPWLEIKQKIQKYVKNGNNILDLGCGNGRLLKSLSNSNLNNLTYLGFDNNKILITKAREIKIKDSFKVKFVYDDILNLNSLETNSFDIIFIIAVLNHFPTLELRHQILTNIYRILKPGGKLIMTNWNLWNFNNKKSVWYKDIFNKNSKFGSLKLKDIITMWQNKYPLYYYAFYKKELEKELISAQFKVLENYYVKKGKKVFWWNGFNILTVGEK